MALVIGNLYINPISTFNLNSSRGEGKKITHVTRKILQLALDVIGPPPIILDLLLHNGKFISL